jgi:NAD(P)-dependent dehydrogenase (short-subunit alcohol dehydrogenase family)
VSDPRAVTAAFEQAGSVDILVNNAGQADSAPFSKTTDDMWRRMMSVNLDGTMYCSRAALPAMAENGWGRIVNIASTAGLTGYSYVTAYCAAKHAVVGFTRALALEVATKGITVNAVCPGFTETDMLTTTIANIVSKTGKTSDQARAELALKNPQRRMVRPEEVANAVLWLCLPGSEAVTGQSIVVAGGEVMP